jgi:hypothetical protein
MPFKIWFTLSALVLLVHLALLHALPASLRSEAVRTTSAFATRTISLMPLSVPAPIEPAVVAESQSVPETKQVPEPRSPQLLNEVKSVENARVRADALAMTSAESDAERSAVTATLALSDSNKMAAVLNRTPTEQTPASDAVQASFSPDGLPSSIKLVYDVGANKFSYSLRGELVWQQMDNTYEARMSLNSTGYSRVQTSRGLIGKDGLAPERFSDKYRSEVAAHFNHERGIVTFSANTPDAKLHVGAQDRLSIWVQLAALVAAAPDRYSQGTTLSVQIVGPRDADLWVFGFGDMEQLELSGGPVQGLKVERKPRQKYDQRIELWLAPSLSYLPARIRITEANGDYLDQKWVSSHPVDAP